MKTIYARLGDLQLGDTLEDGTTVGQIGDALGKVGINIQTANGDLRNMGDVIEELMDKWDQLNTAEQQALAVKLAGKYQYNNLIALLDNAEMYNEQLEASENSLGTINQQQQIYMDSLEGKLNSMQGAFEGLLGSIFNVDDIKPAIDDITELIKLLTSFTSSIGSSSLFAGIIGTGTRVFSKNIADSVGNLVKNRQDRRRKDNDAVSGKNMLRDIGEDPSKYHEKSATFQAAKSLGSRTNIMNEEQLKRAQSLLKQMAAQENEILAKRQQSQAAIAKLNAAYKMVDATAEEVKLTEDGQIENLEKAKATIENMKTAFENVNTTSKELSVNLEKALPGLTQSLEALTAAETLTGNQMNGKRRRGNNQASSALNLISNKDIFDLRTSTGQQYQQMFGSMESFTALGAAYAAASNQVNDYNKAQSHSKEEMIQYKQAIEDVRNKLIAFIQELREMGDISPELIQSLEKLGIETKQLGMAAEQTGTAVRDMTKELDLKNVTMSIASIAGDLAQIYSVLSSIKSLGGIIADDSLDGGEKLGQIIENLVFTLPMGLSSISSITTEIGNLKGSLGKISGTFRTAAQAASVAGTAANGFKTALKGITAVVKANPAMFAVSVGVTALSAIFAKMGFDEQQNENAEEARQKVLDDYDELTEKLEATQEAQSKVREQYDIYKQTGVLTDDLVDAIKDYADSLDTPLNKQDLWNENIDKTIQKLELAAQIQARGAATTAQQALEISRNNFQTSLYEKNLSLKSDKDVGWDMAYEARDAFANNPEASSELREYMSSNGLDFDNSLDLVQTLYDINSKFREVMPTHGGHPEMNSPLGWLNALANPDTLAEVQKETGINVGYQTIAAMSSIGDLGSYGEFLSDPYSGLAVNSSAMYSHVIAQAIGTGDELKGMNIGLDKNGEIKIELDPENLLEGLNEWQAFQESGITVKDLQNLAGVSGETEGEKGEAAKAYESLFSQIPALGSSDEATAYMEDLESATFQSVLADLTDRQMAGEEITIETILSALEEAAKNDPEALNYLSSDVVITDFATRLAEAFGIELDDKTKSLINESQERVGESSQAYSDVQAREHYQDNVSRLTTSEQKVTSQQWDEKGNYSYTSGPGLSEEDLQSLYKLTGADTLESQTAWTDALLKIPDLDLEGYENIQEFYQRLKDAHVDDATATAVVQNTENMAKIADGDAEDLYDSTVRSSDRARAQEKATQQYVDINRFSTSTDEELSAEATKLFDAEWQYLQSLVDKGIITADEAQAAFMQVLEEGAGKLKDGTSKVNENLEEAARGTINLKNASDDATKAFEAVQDQVYADLEQKGYTGSAVTASNFSNRIMNNVGEEGLIGVYQAIGAGVFDSIVDADNYIQSAIEAGIPKEVIVQWIQEKIQEGVNVDISAEYHGEMDDELFARQKTDREAQEKLEEFGDYRQSRADFYGGSSNPLANEKAMADVNSLDSFLDQYHIKLQDLAEWGIDYTNMTLDEIQQAVEDHYSGFEKFANGMEIIAGWTKDQAREIYDYGQSLGWDQDQIAQYAAEAVEAGLSTEQLRNRMANLKEGIDSTSSHALEMAAALKQAFIGREGYSTDDEIAARVEEFDPKTIDALADKGLLDTKYNEAFGSIVDTFGDDEKTLREVILPYLDTDTLDEQIYELNLDPPTFYLRAEINNKQDIVKSVQDAVNSGGEIDAGDLAKLYDFAPELRQFSLYSQQGKEALKELQEQLNDMDLQALMHEYQVLISVDKNSFKNVDEYNAYVDKMTKIQREIDIKIKSNTDQIISDVSDLNSQIESTQDLIDENNGLITADQFYELYDLWPELCEGATIYANDTMQLSQDAVAAWQQSSSQMLQATIDEKKEQLLAQAKYYRALESANTIAASQYKELLDGGVTDAQEAKDKQAQIADNLTKATAAAGGEQVDNAATANETEDANYRTLTGNVAGYYGTMAEDAASSANSQITSINAIGIAAQTVFNSIASLVTGALQGKSGVVNLGAPNAASLFTSAGLASGDSYNHNTTSKSGAATETAGEISADDVKSSIKAAYDEALANATYYGNIANDLEGKASQLDVFNAPGDKLGKKKGSSGGNNGGSGSGGEENLSQKDALEDEADRYEKVNAQLDKMSNLLDQITTEQERLAGFNQLDYSQKEIENLQKQIELQQEKLALEEQERKEKKEALSKNYGVTFDDDGYISNYKERFNAYLTEINALIAQYNAASSKEDQDAINERIEAKQKEFDNYKDLVDKYDELNSNTIEQTKKDIQDLHDKIEDLMLDIFNKAVDAADAIKDVEDKWADFLKATDARDQDDPLLNMEIASKKLANFFDDSSDSVNKYYDTAIARYEELKKKTTDPAQQAAIQKLIDNAKAGKAAQGKGTVEEGGSGYLDMLLSNGKLLTDNIKQYNETGKSDLFGENQAGMMEAAQTVYDQIADAIIDLRSAIDDLQDAIIDSIDYMADKIEEMDDQYDNISKKLDHTSTMLTYAYGDNAYDKQIQVYQTQLALQKSQLTNSIASRDKLKEVVSGLKEGSKERKEAEEKLQEQEEKIYEQTENIAETASQLLNAQANNSVNKWINSWFKFGEDEDQAAMGTDLDWYATQWELINRNADYYLDDVNKAYNIQKLQSQYVDLLDNTSALSTQKKITEQMNQQLGYLRDKTKLSEYDVSYAQAQLEILKQQIALEEAQANKSQMKLRRDSQGNYNYVYTANQDDVKSAQDGLLDAQNNAYNLSKDNLRQSQEDSLSAIQQVKQTLIDIWTDASLTVEQKQARMNFIISNFQEYIQSTGEQISTSEANIINDFYGMVESLTEANAGGLTEIYDTMKAGSLDAFNEIDGHWGNIMSNVTSYIADMNDFGEDLVDTMTKTVEDYNSVIEDAAEKSGVNLKNVESNFEDINAAVGTLEESCKSLQNTLQTVTDSILSMGNSLTKYQNQILSLTNENSELTKIINELRAELNKTNHETAAGATESAATGGVNGGKGNGSSGKGNGSGTGNGGSGDGVPKVGDLATLVWGDYYYDSWGETPNDNVNLGIENGVKIDWRSSTKYGGVSDQTGDFDVHIQGSGLNGSIPYDDLGWVKLSQLKGYDTGGYTGDWNDGSGKLALLHSKEIVLNAADTENILKAVESVRAMTSAMKGASLAEAVGSIGNLGRSIESSIGTVDQNVNITAEFPNATSADEIKEAILGLNNQVLHYAHRRV